MLLFFLWMEAETFQVDQVFDKRDLVEQLLVLVLPVPAEFVLSDRRGLQRSDLSEVRMLDSLLHRDPLPWAESK